MHDVTKSELRAYHRVARADFVDQLSGSEKAIAFSTPPFQLRELFHNADIVAGYVPVGSEADPGKLLQYAFDHGCKTALPYVTSRASPMQFLCWSPGDTLESGPFGLKQPSSQSEPCRPDVILVPLVAFNHELMRLGQGAGHYDRALSMLDNAFTVGIAWSVQETQTLPIDPWDIPLNAILTEKAWITR
jgi:5-formyltetrahydrofolate cyclo-ligase